MTWTASRQSTATLCAAALVLWVAPGAVAKTRSSATKRHKRVSGQRHKAAHAQKKTNAKAKKTFTSPWTPRALRVELRARITAPKQTRADLVEALMWANWAASAGQATAATTALRGLAVAKAHQTLEETSTQAMINDVAHNLQRLSRFHSALASAKALKHGEALLLSLSDLAKAGATVAEQLNRATPAKTLSVSTATLAKRAAPWIEAPGATNGMARLSFGAGLRDLVRKTQKGKQPPNLPSEVLSGVVLLSLNQATHTHYALVALAKSRGHLTKPWLKLVLGALHRSAQETTLALNVLATQRALGAMATPLKGLSRVLQRGTAALTAAQTWLLTGGDAGQFDANLERYRQELHTFTDSLMNGSKGQTAR